jgi:serine/threonine-protein kinase HipA
MPVRNKSYVFPRDQLHPIFNQYIPEGYLFEIFKALLSKEVGELDELTLLAVLAPSIKGRLTFSAVDMPPSLIDKVSPTKNPEPLLLDELIHKEDDLFEELLEQFLYRSAIGGIQPKVLGLLRDKINLCMDDYIIKTSGEAYPFLTVNEYFCLQAARYAGLPVPEFFLSDSQKLLIIKRFAGDKNPAVGFEEMAVLLGKTNRQKYEGSYEQIARAISLFTAPSETRTSLEQYFMLIVLMVLLRNGDAHLKNFGVLYGTGQRDCRLAPPYDLVTTTCYLPHDTPALALFGRKSWWNKKKLFNFAEQCCMMTPRRSAELWDSCISAVSQVRRELMHYCKEHPDFKDIGERMLQDWQIGEDANGDI